MRERCGLLGAGSVLVCAARIRLGKVGSWSIDLVLWGDYGFGLVSLDPPLGALVDV